MSTVYDTPSATDGIYTLYLIPSAVSSVASPRLRARIGTARRRPLWNSLLPWRRDGARSLAPPALFSRSPPHQHGIALEGLHLRSRTSAFSSLFSLSPFVLSLFFLSSVSHRLTFRSLQIGDVHPHHVFPAKLCRVLSPFLAVNQLPLFSLSFMSASQLLLPSTLPPSLPPSLPSQLKTTGVTIQ